MAAFASSFVAGTTVLVVSPVFLFYLLNQSKSMFPVLAIALLLLYQLICQISYCSFNISGYFGLVKFPVNEALTGMFSNLAASVGDNFAINELASAPRYLTGTLN
jgi:hypothetical protein